ncbi:MAG TPA: NYN domain-containing protein [Edaphobacter sp.]|nr:NYN domain-containing protein [Edaphobacter sp.]
MVVNGGSGSSMVPPKKFRVISYIDGFNLYFGMRSKGWQKYMWLDLSKLSQSILVGGQSLQRTKYFTSRVRGSASKEQRQSAWLDAVATVPNVATYWGHYQPDTKTCQKCGHSQQHPQEKKTDVNIATQLLCDAYRDDFDTAIVVSGDADLVPPILAVREYFPRKRIIVAFPPDRYSRELQDAAHYVIHIRESRFRKSRLPMDIELPSGVKIGCPTKWRY